MQTLKVREKKVSVHTYNYDNIIEFLNITKDILENPTVKQMKNFRQHYDCSCYEHCLEVAYWSYLFCKNMAGIMFLQLEVQCYMIYFCMTGEVLKKNCI